VCVCGGGGGCMHWARHGATCPSAKSHIHIFASIRSTMGERRGAGGGGWIVRHVFGQQWCRRQGVPRHMRLSGLGQFPWDTLEGCHPSGGLCLIPMSMYPQAALRAAIQCISAHHMCSAALVMAAGGPHTQDCVIPGAAAAYLVSWSNTCSADSPVSAAPCATTFIPAATASHTNSQYAPGVFIHCHALGYACTCT
jgi:hypothetical protein